MDADTGRILFNDEAERLGLWYIYRVSATRLTHPDSGPSPNAHFDHATPAGPAADRPGLPNNE
jgi:hypothetical protein